jgi:hypothetical protein
MCLSIERRAVGSTGHQPLNNAKEKPRTNQLQEPALLLADAGRSIARIVRPDAGCCSLAADVVGRQHGVSQSLLVSSIGVCVWS